MWGRSGRGRLIVDRGGRHVLAHRLDRVQRGRLACVRLAGRHDLTVACDQVEAELVVARLLHDELHYAPPTTRVPGYGATSTSEITRVQVLRSNGRPTIVAVLWRSRGRPRCGWRGRAA